jgi:isopenicillin-N N-acyltransferase like protein
LCGRSTGDRQKADTATVGLERESGHPGAGGKRRQPVRDRYEPLLLRGTPYERGLTHGRVLAREIHAVTELWKKDLERSYARSADEVIERFLDATGFVRSMQERLPDLYDEIRGIAVGSGMDLATMTAFQMVDELWLNGEDVLGGQCTCVGFHPSGDEPAVVAQTIDVERFRDRFQAVLRIQGSGTEMLIMTCAGLIGFNGLNDHGVGVCCNAEMELAHADRGLPVACVVRGVLAQRSRDEAAAFLQEIEHASGQSYLLGDPDGVRAYECTPHGVVGVDAQSAEGAVWHTNHPLASQDHAPWYRALVAAHGDNPFLENSRIRLETVKRLLGGRSFASRSDRVTGILTSRESARHPICAAGEGDELYAEVGLFTFAATVMTLSSPPQLRYAFGPPDRNPFYCATFVTPSGTA